MKRVFVFTVFILVLFGIGRLYYHLTDDFRLSNITYDMNQEEGWVFPRQNPKIENQVAAILNQEYFYLGKGAQSYAFESADHLYVLKFFKFKHLRPNIFVRMLPELYPFKEYKTEAYARKRRKLHDVFDGYELAYLENRAISELIYLHIKPTDYLEQKVVVVDKLGLHHEIDLDKAVFLLQRKGKKLRDLMNQLLASGNINRAKRSIAQIFAMYVKEYKKGLYDADPGVMHNTGFIGDRAFHLDMGKLTKDNGLKEPELYRKDLGRVAWKMDVWISHHYPECYAELSSFIAQEYLFYTGHHFDSSLVDLKWFKKKG